MDSELPSAQTTLVILLGASAWPLASELLETSTAFVNSAKELRAYFLEANGFNLPQENLLDLFDSDFYANQLYDEVGLFLKNHIGGGKASDAVRDVLLYYIGHGGLSEGNSDFYLAIRRTGEILEGSSIDIRVLAKILKALARFQRRLLILDCCFAASAVNHFQGESLENVVKVKTEEVFKQPDRGNGTPSKGTSLLCSSRNTARSRILPDETSTMFTQAFLQVLRTGDPYQKQKLSLSVVRRLTSDFLLRTYETAAPLPEVHSPDQSEGDVASIPLFPNAAPALLSSGGETREISVVFAEIRGYTRINRSTELENVASLLNRYLKIMYEAIGEEEGTITSFQGDTLMAIFNAPQPQKKHALHAVRAAWKIRMAVQDYQISQPQEMALSLALGVNTGLAWLGTFGLQEGMQSYSAVGDVVNVASRLVSSASDNNILINEMTYMQVSRFVQTGQLFPLAVKNKAAPLNVCYVQRLV